MTMLRGGRSNTQGLEGRRRKAWGRRLPHCHSDETSAAALVKTPRFDLEDQTVCHIVPACLCKCVFPGMNQSVNRGLNETFERREKSLWHSFSTGMAPKLPFFLKA